VNGSSTVALVRTSLMLEARQSITLFSIVNWVCCLTEYCLPLSIFMDVEHHLCSLSPLTSECRCTVALVRESLMFEARGSSTLFSILNWFGCLRKYCLPLSVFMGEEHHLCAKLPSSSEWNQHCISCKRSMNVRSRRVKHLVFWWELSYLFKGILPTTQYFHDWGISPLCKITPLKWMEEALCLL
jgi:hypothetical protein